MAKRLTDPYANAVLNWIRGVTPDPISSPQIALFTTAPAADGTGGVQVTGGSYAPQPVTLLAPSAGATSNQYVVTFVNLPACTVVAVALIDGVSGAVVWYDDGLSVSIAAGENRDIPVGDFDLALIAA